MMILRRGDHKTAPHGLCELAQSKCTWRCDMSYFMRRKFKGKMPQNRMNPKTRTHTLCEPAQSKYTSTFHKNHFIKRKFTGKMPRPKLGPEHRRTLCASLRSRNACQNFTRAT